MRTIAIIVKIIATIWSFAFVLGLLPFIGAVIAIGSNQFPESGLHWIMGYGLIVIFGAPFPSLADKLNENQAWK